MKKNLMSQIKLKVLRLGKDLGLILEKLLLSHLMITIISRELTLNFKILDLKKLKIEILS
jgi:hypothetical protein